MKFLSGASRSRPVSIPSHNVQSAPSIPQTLFEPSRFRPRQDVTDRVERSRPGRPQIIESVNSFGFDIPDPDDNFPYFRDRSAGSRTCDVRYARVTTRSLFCDKSEVEVEIHVGGCVFSHDSRDTAGPFVRRVHRSDPAIPPARLLPLLASRKRTCLRTDFAVDTSPSADAWEDRHIKGLETGFEFDSG